MSREQRYVLKSRKAVDRAESNHRIALRVLRVVFTVPLGVVPTNANDLNDHSCKTKGDHHPLVGKFDGALEFRIAVGGADCKGAEGVLLGLKLGELLGLLEVTVGDIGDGDGAILPLTVGLIDGALP